MKKEIAGFKFITENGFVSELPVVETAVTRAVEPYEVPRDIRKAAMQGKKTELVMLLEKEEELDVPEFMKNRKKSVSVRNNVLHVDFSKQEEEEEEELSMPERIMDGMIDAGKKAVSPLTKFFFPEE